MEKPNLIARAFEIAPEYATVAEVKQQLRREGYSNVESHFAGKHLKSHIFERLNPATKKPQGRQPKSAPR